MVSSEAIKNYVRNKANSLLYRLHIRQRPEAPKPEIDLNQPHPDHPKLSMESRHSNPRTFGEWKEWAKCTKDKSAPSNTQRLSSKRRQFDSFPKLPLEMVLLIARQSRPIDAASLALTSKVIHALLELEFLPKGRKESGLINHKNYKSFDTCKLLERLARDLPDHIPCGHCNVLHHIENAEKHTIRGRQETDWDDGRELPCWAAQWELGASTYLHSDFSIPIFQMAMKRYRQGQNTESTRLLNIFNGSGRNYDWGYERIAPFPEKLRRVKTQSYEIINGSLFMRKQWIYPVHPQPTTEDRFTDLGVSFNICPHFYMGWGKTLTDTKATIQFIGRNCREMHESGEGLARCQYCEMEFQIDLQNCGELGSVVMITRWQNLGEGKSTRDPRFLRHLERMDVPSPRKPPKPIEFELASISGPFEEIAAAKFMDILSPKSAEGFLEAREYW